MLNQSTYSWDKDRNIFLLGDNIDLINSIQEKADCVYLDPPYNINAKTVYSDKYTYEELNNLLSSLENKLNPGCIIYCHCTELHFYDYLTIFKKYYDPITTFIRIKAGYAQSSNFAEKHEYILCFSNNKSEWLKKEEPIYPYGNKYKRPLQKTGNYSLEADRPTMAYPIFSPERREIYPIKDDGRMGRWIWAKETYEKRINEIVWDNEKPYIISKAKGFMSTILTDMPTKEYEDLRKRGIKTEGLYPKSRELIKKLILFSRTKNGVVYDLFGGTGTSLIANQELEYLNNKLYCIEKNINMAKIIQKRCIESRYS